MNVKTTCPSCDENVKIDVQSSSKAEYVACPKCSVRWLWEPIDDDLWDEDLDGPIEEIENREGKSKRIIKGDYVAIYATTSKPIIGGLLLIASGIILIVTAILLNGIINDEVKLNGYTNGITSAFDSMGMSEEEIEYVDEEFTKNILSKAIIWEAVCAVLAITGGILSTMYKNYTFVQIGCAASILGLGMIMTSTLLGAIALKLTIDGKHMFGFDSDESW